MTWWDKASTEERFAQVSAGIDLGLTSRQVAMASRTTVGTVNSFAARHEMSFPLKGNTASQRRTGRVRSDKAAYLRGEPVDLWGGGDHRDQFPLDEVAA